MHAVWWRLGSLLLVAAALDACVRFEPAYNQPADGTYEPRVYQVKIDDSARSIRGAEVTREFFQGAGAQPLLGRFFVEGDEGSSPVVVLSHELWTERFNSSPEVIGRTIEIDGRQATVVGVGPPQFQFPDGAQLWTPRGRVRTPPAAGQRKGEPAAAQARASQRDPRATMRAATDFEAQKQKEAHRWPSTSRCTSSPIRASAA
jgi:hypothetical protein